MYNYKHLLTGAIGLLCLTGCHAGGGNAPGTFLIKPGILVEHKQAIQSGDEPLKQALSLLVTDAEKTLSNGPYSVTYKTKLPPSGDKHDYMSVGPYWWPDTTKADGLPYIRKDGVTNPERHDIEDAEFFKNLCRDIRLLALAYYYTTNERYAEKAVSLLRVWFLDAATRMNPNLNYGQAIPGITDGRGIGLIDTRASVYLIDGIQLLKDSQSLTASDYEGLQHWYAQFLDWMTTSSVGLDEADEHNNHGTYYDIQTVSTALFIGQTERAARMLEEQTKARIESQFMTDGSQPHELARTQSWGYSQMNLSGFFELAALAENVQIDLWNYVSPGGKSIQKAYLWMLPYADGNAWTYQELKIADKSDFANLARIAYTKYKDERTSIYLTKSRESDYLFKLTH
jgi:hypothetical protein